LAPTKSLQRLDAATGRVVTAVGLVAPVLTGLGLLAAGLPNLSVVGRVLAVVAAVLAVVALLLALWGQVVTVTRGLDVDNQPEIRRWFTEQFDRRSCLVQWSAGLLVAAVAAAAAAAVSSLVFSDGDEPTLSATRTADGMTADITFRRLDPGQFAVASISVEGQEVVQAAFGPGPDGTAARSLTATKVPAAAHVLVTAHAAEDTCTATFAPGRSPVVECKRS
jgi:hypothetical protein